MPKFVKLLMSLPSKSRSVLSRSIQKLASMKKVLNRTTFANLLMFSFILFTSIGAALIFVPAGLIVAGVACGIFGYLLGAE